MWLYFCHIQWFLFFFFLTFYDSIITLGSTNITSDYTSVTFSGIFFFSLTFDSFIFTLGSTNITSDRTFITFGGSLFFISHLIIPSSHWTISISHLIVLLYFGPPLKSLFQLLSGRLFALPNGKKHFLLKVQNARCLVGIKNLL